ncbi:MAG: collagen binding domain-containing protein [Candidatus Thorarchaeota archaeon]
MNKKALVIIVLYIALIAFQSDQYSAHGEQEYQIVIDDVKDIENELIDLVLDIEKESTVKTELTALDLTSPSYTNLQLSENSPIAEGTDVFVQSTTISTGVGVSSGNVDFIDYQIYTIDDDTTSDSIYSNKFAIKISLPASMTIYGFLVDISPTIREDINFYIRNSITGANVRTGLLSKNFGDSANSNDQMLLVPFSYCGVSSLTMNAATDYYFILEPTISTSNSFFELVHSSNIQDDVSIYNWSGSEYQEIIADTRFYLIIQELPIASDISVNSSGEASTTWTAIEGNHSIVAFYEGTMFYTESYGVQTRKVIAPLDQFFIEFDSQIIGYKDNCELVAVVTDEYYTPVGGKLVSFYYSIDEGENWITIGSGITDSFGEAILSYQFSNNPGNYTTKAIINAISSKESYVIIEKEALTWNNIDFYGKYRNNPGFPEEIGLTANIQVLDDEGSPVPNFDFELWFKYDGRYEFIAHYYSTDENGLAEIIHGAEELAVGINYDTHYFKPASYEYGYTGNSAYGETIIDKGDLSVAFSNYNVEWLGSVILESEITSLDEGMANVEVEFSYYYNNQWNVIGTTSTDSTGIASLNWSNINLEYGTYQLRAKTIEDNLFYSNQSITNVSVERKGINIYIINDGLPKGNGEEIDVEYTTTMNLVFYVTYDDGSPAANMVIEIKGRLLDEFFFKSLGFITTDENGFATFNHYEKLTLVGFQYACIAEIDQNGKYDGAQLYFKINLIKCNPVIVLADVQGQKGTYIEFSAYIFNCEGIPLENVIVQFIINGVIYQTVSDHNGLARVTVAPLFAAGNYSFTCRTVEDDKFTVTQKQANLLFTKGVPYFTVLEAAAMENGYLTIRVFAYDSLGRPISGLQVRLSFSGWSEILTTDSNGLISYTFQLLGYNSGNYLLILTFDGNSNWLQTEASGNLLIYENESELELHTAEIYCYYGDEVYFEAKLKTNQGYPLINRVVQFIIIYDNGSYFILGENNTDILGIARYRTTIDILPNSYDWGVIYSGATDYGPSKASEDILIEKSITNIMGSNFQAVAGSTATFQVALYNHLGIGIGQQFLDLYIWIDNSWMHLSKFVTNSNGFAYISIVVPTNLGKYYLKVEFEGSAFYQENSLPIEMTAITAPPKIMPNLVLEIESPTIADHELLPITLRVSNAISGSAITVYIHLNGNLTGTVLIVNGIGEFIWNSSKTGTFVLIFTTYEDSLYLATIKELTITVEENTPPQLVSFSYTDYLCEGEAFYIEVVLLDPTGINAVWFIANGTKIQMNKISESKYSLTVFMLREGLHAIAIEAEDNQGNIAIFDLDSIKVYARKTQVIRYHLNSKVIEEGKSLTIEALIYSENPIEQVIFKLNSTEYLMILDYQIDPARSVWKITIDDLSIGNYFMTIKIVEKSSSIIIDEITETILVIPNTPKVNSNNWIVRSTAEGDYINGNLTIISYYEIISVQIWIDGVEFTVIKIGENLYNYYGIISHAKTHTMRIVATDSEMRVYENEIVLGSQPGINILTISLVVSCLVFLVLVSVGVLVAKKYLKKAKEETPNGVIEVEEIIEEELPFVEFNLDTPEPIISSDDINIELLFEEPPSEEIHSEFNSKNNVPAEIKEPAVAASQPKKVKSKQKSSTPVVPVEEQNLTHIKEYLMKVKEEGIIDEINGNGHGSKKKKDTIDTIEQMTSFSIEIDRRLLPKEEQLALLEEESEEEMDSSIFDLKEITDEIEQTLSKG